MTKKSKSEKSTLLKEDEIELSYDVRTVYMGTVFLDNLSQWFDKNDLPIFGPIEYCLNELIDNAIKASYKYLNPDMHTQSGTLVENLNKKNITSKQDVVNFLVEEDKIVSVKIGKQGSKYKIEVRHNSLPSVTEITKLSEAVTKELDVENVASQVNREEGAGLGILSIRKILSVNPVVYGELDYVFHPERVLSAAIITLQKR